jgi:O-antigen/teichoic acid export membrane protein
MEGYGLKEPMTTGVKWTSAGHVAGYMLQFLAWATLGRLLPPDNFAALGTAVRFSNHILVLGELGTSTALAQKKDAADLVLDYLPNEGGKVRSDRFGGIMDDVLK